MLAVILTRASAEHGYGHLSRCRVLGCALRDLGHEVRLLVRGDAATERFLDLPWASVLGGDTDAWPQADLCVVDLYDYEDPRYARLREHFGLIAIFDDCEYRVPQLVSAVVNPNIHAEESRYPPGIKVFTGRDYVLVRPEFLRLPRSAKAESVLLCVGGSDPTDQMRRLLPILERTTRRPIHAVYGPGFQQSDVIEDWASHPRITSSRAVTDMGRVFAGACYAVTGSGNMLYELAASGVPAACLSLAGNQRPLAVAFGAAGAVEYLGAHDEIGDAELEERLRLFDANAERRDQIASKARRLIDGMGGARLAAALSEWTVLRRDATRSPYSRDEVEREYDLSATLDLEHMRLRWGSAVAMEQRYELVMRELPFDRADTWLDVGCGTGALQERVAQRFPAVRGTGLDLSSRLLEHARARAMPNMIFLHEDFLEHREGAFDIVTCLGVLAKTNMSLPAFFRHAARLLRQGGRVIVDFKHLGWSRFRDPGFYPEARHLWLTVAQVLGAARAESLFEVVKVAGFLPEEGREVEPAESHTVFLVARRTTVPVPGERPTDA